MQQSNYHNRSSRSRYVDGFTPSRRLQRANYMRRSNEILPSNEAEYLAAMTGKTAPRMEQQPASTPPAQVRLAAYLGDLYRKLPKIPSGISRRHATGLLLLAFTLLSVLNLAMARDTPMVNADEDLRQVLQDNGDTPHSKQPYNQLNFQTAPDLPKLLTIQKIGLNVRVTRLSVRENSEPKSPSSIYDVGWYENSAKPGENGAALLIGHVRGYEKAGVFYDLTRLVPGDEFQLETGDGTIRNYQVMKMQTYPRGQVDFAELTQSAVSSRPGLNLLTAVGAFESNADVTQQLGVFAVEKTPIR